MLPYSRIVHLIFQDEIISDWGECERKKRERKGDLEGVWGRGLGVWNFAVLCLGFGCLGGSGGEGLGRVGVYRV